MGHLVVQIRTEEAVDILGDGRTLERRMRFRSHGVGSRRGAGGVGRGVKDLRGVGVEVAHVGGVGMSGIHGHRADGSRDPTGVDAGCGVGGDGHRSAVGTVGIGALVVGGGRRGIQVGKGLRGA